MAADLAVPELVPSLEDIHASVPIPRTWWRRFLAFSGPAFLVSVGYMDPGNWGSDIQAGSKFGYRLLWVLLMSNLMAVLLQSLATRLGVATGRDLAQACRESYPRWATFALWVLTEIAIAATDLAEVIGTVVALKLLFHVPYAWGLVIAAADTFLLLALQRRGVRLLEVVTLALIGVIGVSFVVEIVLNRPDWTAAAAGFLPTLEPGAITDSLYVAIAMLGATVMPHNLYLHSALVQTRAFPQTDAGKRLACKYNFLDSLLALNGAFFINAAILLLAAAKFYPEEVKDLTKAHELLAPQVVGATLAGILFAVALLASGQSSTLTGTLAGQVVMEGFVRLRIRPWLRRLLTRSLALVPALLVIAWAGSAGEPGAVDEDLMNLLVLSQAVLSFQLPFAIVPLVQFTSDRQRMGVFASKLWLKSLAWACAAIVVGLNGVLIYLSMGEWGEALEKQGWSSLWLYGTLGPLTLALAGFLGWVAVYPHWKRRHELVPRSIAPAELPHVSYRNIGVAVELEGADDAVLAQAAALARAQGAKLVTVHVVVGLGADLLGPETDDQESRSDRRRMADLVQHLCADGLDARGVLGYGDPALELVRIAEKEGLDLLVVGTHGHRFLADLALGQTVAPVLHRLTIPVLVVPSAAKAAGDAGGAASAPLKE
jgi:manganese transport protein